MTSWTTRLPQLRAVYGHASHDPFLRGRAATTIGVALLADGLVGLDNPLAGRDRRPGILGAALIAALGIIVILVLGFVIHTSSPYPNGHIAQGTITAVQPHDSNGTKICSATIVYNADGAAHTIDSDLSAKSLCTQQGQHVPVSYTDANAAAGRPQFAESNWILEGFRALGWLVFAIGAATFLLRLAELVFGVVLIVRGRRLTRSARPTDLGQLLDNLKAAWAGTYAGR